jgi:hypothetical protein
VDVRHGAFKALKPCTHADAAVAGVLPHVTPLLGVTRAGDRLPVAITHFNDIFQAPSSANQQAMLEPSLT